MLAVVCLRFLASAASTIDAPTHSKRNKLETMLHTAAGTRGATEAGGFVIVVIVVPASSASAAAAAGNDELATSWDDSGDSSPPPSCWLLLLDRPVALAVSGRLHCGQ